MIDCVILIILLITFEYNLGFLCNACRAGIHKCQHSIFLFLFWRHVMKCEIWSLVVNLSIRKVIYMKLLQDLILMWKFWILCTFSWKRKRELIIGGAISLIIFHISIIIICKFLWWMIYFLYLEIKS